MNENPSQSAEVSLRLDVKKLLRGVLLLGLLLLAAVAMMIQPEQYNPERYAHMGVSSYFNLLRKEIGIVDVAHIAALCALYALLDRMLLRKDQPFCLTAFLVGGVLSAFLLLGDSFSAFNSFAFLADSACQFLIAGTVGLGYLVILYSLLKLFYTWLDGLSIKKVRYEGVLNFINGHFAAVSLVAMLVCWAMLARPYFPGSVPYDGRNQLNMVHGYFEMHTHHPYYSTLIMGLVYGMGEKIFGITGGCVCYVVFQSLVCGAVFAQICEYIRMKTRRLLPGMLCLLFFAVCPMWWTYMQAIIKDTLYVGVFALFVLETVKIFLKDEKKWDYVALGVSGVLTCCLRNGCQYVVFPALLALILAVTDRRKQLCAVCALALVGNYAANTLVIDALQLTPVNQVEALSIPLQQIARYVTYHEDELTEEEKHTINRVVLYDGIPERYNPEISDPIKDRYRNTNEEEWTNFWQLWLSKLKDDPALYITATMNNIFGYIDPFYYQDVLSRYPLYTKSAIKEADQDAVYSEYYFPVEQRNNANDTANLWENIPGLSLVVSCGTYTWIGFILIAGLLRKRLWRSALLFTAPLMTLLICFASPVNGLLRYMLPIMAVIPVMILVGFLPHLEQKPTAQ